MGLATTLARTMRAQLAYGPVPELAADRCLRGRYPRSGCRRCADACPAGAIALHPHGLIVEPSCVGCEACLPACPSEALALAPEVREARRRRLQGGEETVTFTCLRHGARARATVAMGCLAGLSLADLLAPLAAGTHRVCLLRSDCDGCVLRGGMDRYRSTLLQARHLLRTLGLSGDLLEEVGSVPTGSTEEVATLGRRELFGRVRRQVAGAASFLLPAAEGGSPGVKAGESQRELLLAALRTLAGESDCGGLPDGFPAARLTVAPTCFGCNVCESLCPTAAVRREVQADDAVRLLFTPARCVACGVCAQACLAQAVALSPAPTLGYLVDEGEHELRRVAPRSCARCGASFTGVPGATCEACLTRSGGRGRLHGGAGDGVASRQHTARGAGRAATGGPNMPHPGAGNRPHTPTG